MKHIAKYLACVIVLPLLVACEKDKFTDSIFIDPVVKTDSYTYEFDQWLKEYFTIPYNCEFRYKMEDAATDPNYNIVPVRLGMADTLAHLALYLWYNTYDTVMNRVNNPTFLKDNGPRMIQLIGSSMINAAQGTEKLGYAEGGIKITLMKINKMNWYDIDLLNEYIFKTMHHEFSHILHQKKTYPKEDFETITPLDYDVDGWQYKSNKEANELGFVSNYARCEFHEDFVETIANYIVKSDADWQEILDNAGPNAKLIEQKWTVCHDWLLSQWNIDIDEMRKEVQARQEHLDYEQIMKCNFDWKNYPVK